MRFLIITLLFALSAIYNLSQAQCTSISRANASALNVLTSSKYNTDLNTVYSAVNAFDGGCITAGTLEAEALSASDFAPLLKGLKEGCKVSYTNASTLSVSECLASVNGEFVSKNADTSVSFGCAGCSSEAASTAYYVYIQTGSTGTTLTPLILTGAPNDDGYDGTGNKVLAKFYNAGTSDIDQYSMSQWIVNGFDGRVPRTSYTPDTTQGLGTIVIAADGCKFSRRDEFLKINCKWTNGTVTSSIAQFALPGDLQIGALASEETYDVGSWIYNGNAGSNGGIILATKGRGFLEFSANSVYGSTSNVATTAVAGTEIGGTGAQVVITAEVPIEGWE